MSEPLNVSDNLVLLLVTTPPLFHTGFSYRLDSRIYHVIMAMSSAVIFHSSLEERSIENLIKIGRGHIPSRLFMITHDMISKNSQKRKALEVEKYFLKFITPQNPYTKNSKNYKTYQSTTKKEVRELQNSIKTIFLPFEKSNNDYQSSINYLYDEFFGKTNSLWHAKCFKNFFSSVLDASVETNLNDLLNINYSIFDKNYFVLQDRIRFRVMMKELFKKHNMNEKIDQECIDVTIARYQSS